MAFDPLYLQPGDLRHKITIEAPSETLDDYGQPLQQWTPVVTTRASIRAITQKEMNVADTAVAVSTHVVMMRYPGKNVRIVTGQRITFENSHYRITDVDDILERHRVLKLQCVIVDSST